MSADTPNGGRRGLYLAAVTTAVLAVVGVFLLASGRPPQGPPQPSSSVAVPTQPTTGESGQVPATKANEVDLGPILPASPPVSLDIPSIDVHSNRLVALAYTTKGELEVPTDFDLPGWFSPGPSPGQFGPSVIAGHVDSKAGPAVFYRLGALKPGATVKVGRADGTTATFQVDTVERYPKDEFPTTKVYGNSTNRAELRLITCGGKFDDRTGHYVDNVVAYAHLIS